MKNPVNPFVEWLIDNRFISFGDHKLKSGRISPYFVNTGRINDGTALFALAKAYGERVRDLLGEFDKVIIVGPPYKGTVLAPAIAMAIAYELNSDYTNKHVHYCSYRKEAKDHGEAGFWVGKEPEKNDCVVIVDDVITTGATKFEVVELLRALRVDILGCVVAFDRMETFSDGSTISAAEMFTAETGIEVRAAASAIDLLRLGVYWKNLNVESSLVGNLDRIILYCSQFGSQQLIEAVHDNVAPPDSSVNLIKPSAFVSDPEVSVMPPEVSKSSNETNPIIVALDGMDIDAAKNFVAILKHHVWGFKLNDLFLDEQVQSLLDAHFDARWFVDLKLHDIPNTVANQVKRLKKRVPNCQYLTVHASGGERMIRAAVDAAQNEVKILAVTVLTSIDERDCANIFGADIYWSVQRLAKLAEASDAHGVVCSAHELSVLASADVKLEKIVPGIRPLWHQDKADDQQRITVPIAARDAGATKIVIGRPITQSNDPVKAALDTLNEWNRVGPF